MPQRLKELTNVNPLISTCKRFFHHNFDPCYMKIFGHKNHMKSIFFFEIFFYPLCGECVSSIQSCCSWKSWATEQEFLPVLDFLCLEILKKIVTRGNPVDLESNYPNQIKNKDGCIPLQWIQNWRSIHRKSEKNLFEDTTFFLALFCNAKKNDSHKYLCFKNYFFFLKHRQNYKTWTVW